MVSSMDPGAVEANVSVKRLEKFLSSPEITGRAGQGDFYGVILAENPRESFGKTFRMHLLHRNCIETRELNQELCFFSMDPAYLQLFTHGLTWANWKNHSRPQESLWFSHQPRMPSLP